MSVNIGTRLPVMLEGIVVGEAIVEDIEGDDATIIIPATRLVMRVARSLEPKEHVPETERILVGATDTQSDTASPAEGDSAAPAPTAAEIAAAKALLARTDPSPQDFGGTYSQDVGEGIHNKQLDSSALD